MKSPKEVIIGGVAVRSLVCSSSISSSHSSSFCSSPTSPSSSRVPSRGGGGGTLCARVAVAHQLGEFLPEQSGRRVRVRGAELPEQVERGRALEGTGASEVLEHEGCFQVLVRESVRTFTS